MRATYSPDDNKIRIYPDERLDEATYARVKAAGYMWAPKQQIHIAPMWTPGRAALAIELCGEIGDEDTTLAERAEARAERFEDLSERRTGEAERTQEAVADLVQNGSVTIGHHSRARAEKEAKKVESTIKRAVDLWDEADYWARRAKGALRHAKYKENAGVRHRRIKGIEADKRKSEKQTAEAFRLLKYWEMPGLTKELAIKVSSYYHVSERFLLADYPRDPPASQYEGPMGLWSALTDGVITVEQAAEIAIKTLYRNIAHNQKWHDHYENRLAYERAMLDEQGGLISDKFDIKVGGKVLVNGAWLVVLRVNKSLGKVNSVTTQAPAGHWCKDIKVEIEAVKEYQEPTEELVAAVKATKAKIAPLVNFYSEGFREMTKAEWAAFPGGCKGIDHKRATDTTGAYRIKYALLNNSTFRSQGVFITDAKVVEIPGVAPVSTAPALPTPDYMDSRPRLHPTADPVQSKRDEFKEALKNGVQVVSANQLFPTPPLLARRMVEILDIRVGDRLLEPSAGTGVLLGSCGGKMFGAETNKDQIVAVEINPTLAHKLRSEFPLTDVRCKDFLECNGDLGKFDKILMNPPFEKGSDIKHIEHALGFLKPGGIMVAICANGPRQNEKLRDLATVWEDLPPGTFASSGTNVNTAMLTFYG